MYYSGEKPHQEISMANAAWEDQLDQSTREQATLIINYTPKH